jgi:diaminopimelate decarboxylase
MKKRYKEINLVTLVFSLSLIMGCRIYKTDPLSYNGEQKFQHNAKVNRNRMEFINYGGGIDTIYTGMIKTSNTGNVWSEYKFKTRLKTIENGRFYLVEFTNVNSEYTECVWYDINKNQLLLRAAVQMDAKYANGRFTKELLAQIFFVWHNKDYYNN